MVWTLEAVPPASFRRQQPNHTSCPCAPTRCLVTGQTPNQESAEKAGLSHGRRVRKSKQDDN